MKKINKKAVGTSIVLAIIIMIIIIVVAAAIIRDISQKGDDISNIADECGNNPAVETACMEIAACQNSAQWQKVPLGNDEDNGCDPGYICCMKLDQS